MNDLLIWLYSTLPALNTDLGLFQYILIIALMFVFFVPVYRAVTEITGNIELNRIKKEQRINFLNYINNSRI